MNGTPRCFGLFANRSRVTSDKGKRSNFEGTEKNIISSSPSYFALSLSLSLSASLRSRNRKFFLHIQYSSRRSPQDRTPARDGKSLNVSFRPVGRSHTHSRGDNEPRGPSTKVFSLSFLHIPFPLSLSLSPSLFRRSYREPAQDCPGNFPSSDPKQAAFPGKSCRPTLYIPFSTLTSSRRRLRGLLSSIGRKEGSERRM